jgi:hypothetical protein
MDSRLRYQRSEGRASAPPRPNGRDHDAPDEPRFPEHLTAIWDTLSAGLCGLIIGPWDGRNLNQRKRIGDCLTGLRDAGWTLDDCAAVAPRAADGLGKNSHHKTLIPEIWAEISGRRLDGPDFPPTERLLGDLLTTKSAYSWWDTRASGKPCWASRWRWAWQWELASWTGGQASPFGCSISTAKCRTR